MAGPKFGALAQLRTSKPEPEGETPLPSHTCRPGTYFSSLAIHQTAGRPPGKRSNAEWDYANILLRKQTKKLANRKLEDDGADKDLSELVERLLGMYCAGRFHSPARSEFCTSADLLARPRII
jgi:hypothetical protein